LNSIQTKRSQVLAGLALLTLAAIAIHGYHVGIEDQDVYLAAAKKALNPSLYPVNAEFFTEQMQASLFIPALAFTARLFGFPWALALWHVVSLFLILLGCRQIVVLLFEQESARWAAVALVTAMLTIPIAGTALYPVDQYLHPRAPATAGILLAIAAVLQQRWVRAGLWTAAAIAMHPLMAAFGISLAVFLCAPFEGTALTAMLLPFGWTAHVSETWKQAAMARTYYFPLRWHWYEWIGVLAPVILMYRVAWLAKKRKSTMLQRVATRLVAFAIFQTIIALMLTVPESTLQFAALQPMRWLHIFYFFFLIISGGLLGEFVLQRHKSRWLLLFGALAATMFCAQRITFAHSNHIEWPGALPRNEWAKAFLWVRTNTEAADVFALDPKYMDLAGEDAYGFRAWAERSLLAEDQKDPGAATVFPQLLDKWQEQVEATRGIEHFDEAKLRDLNRRFGVNWIILPSTAKPPLANCPFQNTATIVCSLDRN